MDPSRTAGDDSSSGLDLPPLEAPQLLSLALLVLGIGLTLFGATGYVQETAAIENAVEVEATVVDSGVEEVATGRTDPRYVPMATFEYRFQGTTYTSDSVFPRGSEQRYHERAEAESVLADATSGDTVTAYVDPEAPGEAFLTTTRSETSVRFLVFGGFMGLVGGVRFLQTWWLSRDRDVELYPGS